VIAHSGFGFGTNGSTSRSSGFLISSGNEPPRTSNCSPSLGLEATCFVMTCLEPRIKAIIILINFLLLFTNPYRQFEFTSLRQRVPISGVDSLSMRK
jgi:hypothetical protein